MDFSRTIEHYIEGKQTDNTIKRIELLTDHVQCIIEKDTKLALKLIFKLKINSLRLKGLIENCSNLRIAVKAKIQNKTIIAQESIDGVCIDWGKKNNHTTLIEAFQAGIKTIYEKANMAHIEFKFTSENWDLFVCSKETKRR